MKTYKYLIAAGLLLVALTPLQTHAGTNTWTGAASSFWDATDANWTSPTTWAQGDDAIFGPTGAGTVSLYDEGIYCPNMTFNASYTLVGNGMPLTDDSVTGQSVITAAAGTSNYLQLSIYGTNSMTFAGTGHTLLMGDLALNDANHFTGGTYIRSGTVILQAPGVGTSSGSAYAVDSIEALDTNATLVLPGIWNGTSYGSDPDQIAVNGQLSPNISHLNMTGGTLDMWNDPKGQHIPVPQGYGTIINSGSWSQSGLQIKADGLDHDFHGVITDGNNGVLNGDNSGTFNAGQGPGYQIGIVNASGTAPVSGPYQYWNWYGSNTYSGSTRLNNGIYIRLMGQGTIGFPTPNGLTGPMRLYTGAAIDLYGHNQTISLMTSGDSTAIITNSAPNTVSTLTIGYGMEPATRNCPYTFNDNPSIGAFLALRKINTAPYAYPPTAPTQTVTNGVQNMTGVCTYSGDTTVEGGGLTLSTATAVSPNSAYRLFTPNNYTLLTLNYGGTASCRQLWINGVQQPNGVYGSVGNSLGAIGVAGIDPASTGTLTVTGYAPVVLTNSISGSTINFSWAGVYKLQSKTNSIIGPWFDYPGGSTSPVNVTVDKTQTSVFFRLSTY